MVTTQRLSLEVCFEVIVSGFFKAVDEDIGLGHGGSREIVITEAGSIADGGPLGGEFGTEVLKIEEWLDEILFERWA